MSKFYSYEKIKEILDEMPITYRLGILTHCINLCKEKIFKNKEGLKKFINKVLEENIT